ncbi:MAG: repeat-containing protein [Bacteroidetes bacterium]|jgi:uncharacterized protein YuzB (UPF0349 family)|nr:repeat-containing protein [Bacteroidota bacterium]
MTVLQFTTRFCTDPAQLKKKCRSSAFQQKILVAAISILCLLLSAETIRAQTFDSLLMSPFSLPGCGFNAAPAFGDLDNDGDQDMISGGYYGSFTYYKNTGTASVPVYWLSWINPFALTGIGLNSTPTLADLDADGDLDLMVGDYYGSFRYFENTGNPSAPVFGPGQLNPFSLTDIGYNSAPAFADLDNDGDLDLLAGQNYTGFSYFQNTGTATNPVFGTFLYNPFSLSGNVYNSTPAFADLDNDGDKDLLSGGSDGNLRYFENTGTITAPVYGIGQVNPFSLTNPGYGSTLAFADADSDGDMDVMTGEYYGNFRYFPNTGTITAPVFGAVQNNPFNLVVEFQSTPAFADLDNDGDQDMLSGEYYGNLRYYENTGSAAVPVFSSFLINPFSLTNVDFNSAPAFADLDSDGDMDLLVGEYNGDFNYYENTGTPSAPAYGPKQTNPFSLSSTVSTATPAFADLDNDGDLDLMSGEVDGGFKYYTNTGTASAPAFGPAQANPFSLVDIGFKSHPAFADLDNDGDMELLTGDYGGHFFYFVNTGTAQNPVFGTPQVDPFTFEPVGCSSAPTFVDLDNDGDLDVMAGEIDGNFNYFENICIHPAMPGGISETMALCPNDNSIYSIAPVSGATFYNWALPAGWDGESSDDSIFVASGSTGGIISVTASNSCGTSAPATYSVSPVIDSIQPATPVLADIMGTCSVIPATPSTTDDCAGTISGTTTTVFPLTTVGTTIVTWTFDDGNGNTTTADQNIIVSAATIDISVVQNDLTITAGNTTAGVSYQWIDCAGNLPISSETNQSFTATVNGTYAVIITEGLCSDTSACVTINSVGISSATTTQSLVRIYPNPSAGLFIIESAESILQLRITDLAGKLIFIQKENTNLLDLTVYEKGMYLLTATMKNNSIRVLPVIKQD